MIDELRFDDITPIERPVVIGNEKYVLRETSGDAAVQYENARIRCHEYQGGVLVRVKDPANLEPLLVSLCLFDDGGKPVPEAKVRGWPSRVQQGLYDAAREISGMNEPAKSIEEKIEDLQRQLKQAKAGEERPTESPGSTATG